jgi:hypothetical protein
MRKLAAAVLVALLSASCGGGDPEPAPAAPPDTEAATPSEPGAPMPTQGPPSATTPQAAATTAAPAQPSDPAATTPPSSPAPSPTTTVRPRPDGEDAPDFTLALGQGGSFTLSLEQKPVYMVFWAEW